MTTPRPMTEELSAFLCTAREVVEALHANDRSALAVDFMEKADALIDAAPPPPPALVEKLVEALRPLSEKATPAEQWGGNGWAVDHDFNGVSKMHHCIGVHGVGHTPIAWAYRKDDAALIVAAVNLVRQALADALGKGGE